MTDLTVMSDTRTPGRRMPRAALAGLLALVTLLAGLVAVPIATAGPAQASPRIAADYESFFARSALEGAGWTTCPAPITYSIDVSALRTEQRRSEVARMRSAMRQWAEAAGLKVLFTGRERLVVNPASHTLSPADGSALRTRHVYISFIREGVDPLMVDPVAGLAMPARVIPSTGEVVGGVALFRARHVRHLSGRDNAALTALYLHELGHVFSLGHARYAENVMYPVVQRRTSLGVGDARGARLLTLPCPTA